MSFSDSFIAKLQFLFIYFILFILFVAISPQGDSVVLVLFLFGTRIKLFLLLPNLEHLGIGW